MRCFVAINFSEKVTEKIKIVQRQIPDFNGKKTEPENIHLTLKFLGEIEETDVEKVKDRLKKVKSEKFKAVMDSLGVFSKSYVRIVWLHIGGAERLQKEIDEKLSDFFEKENRFMGHITIARVKSLKDKKDFLEKLNKVEFENIEFPVNEFCLMKSELTKSGPRYEILEKFYLD